ncbi:M15 family metallopeptidase [Enterocloster citroniae]|uniref:M15 family metallopeptidase n=1 Tax=Enterocloster citroniae TaxID=358743 RepID=UPI00189C3E75|nr:M15 family metallopeptidase [Enterocloster citroniae]
MAYKKSKDRRVVRNRRVMIYTFLLILALFYISAHRTLEKERGADRAEVEMMAGGDGTAKAQSEVWSGETGLTAGQASRKSEQDANRAQGDELIIGESDLWCLILTNAEYPVPEDYTVELQVIPGTEQSVDVRIYEPLMEMLDAMREQGLAPIICSGYRTLDKQEKLFNRKVQSYVRSGHTKEESYALARQTISIPGSGEHCLGLAVDFYTKKYHKLEKAFENTPEGKWLMEHAQEYGFIMRYGEDKVDITGIEYEPWHYRYVGVEAAEYIKEHNLSLEEFYIEQSLYG